EVILDLVRRVLLARDGDGTLDVLTRDRETLLTFQPDREPTRISVGPFRGLHRRSLRGSPRRRLRDPGRIAEAVERKHASPVRVLLENGRNVPHGGEHNFALLCREGFQFLPPRR